jgi:hypothetical protein
MRNMLRVLEMYGMNEMYEICCASLVIIADAFIQCRCCECSQLTRAGSIRKSSGSGSDLSFIIGSQMVSSR